MDFYHYQQASQISQHHSFVNIKSGKYGPHKGKETVIAW
jgi:hypothetical protein